MKQASQYEQSMDESQRQACRLGKRWSKSLRKQVKRVTNTSDPQDPGIDPIFVPQVLEPLFSVLDYDYTEVGGSNFRWVIDLYIGRKIESVIPLLVEVGKRLKEGGFTVDNKFYGGGDNRWWVVGYHKNPDEIDCFQIRIDSQSMSCEISLSRSYLNEYWTIEVHEWKRSKRRPKPTNEWNDPTLVFKYRKSRFSNDGCRDSWAHLLKFTSFFSWINPLCTSLGIKM